MHRQLLGLFACIAVLASGTASLASDTVCDPQGCIAVSKFTINLYHALDGKVVGYAINVGGFFPYYGGWARTAADPPRARMGGGLRMNVASVSKVLTTIGVLQSMSKHKLTLDDKISPFLYPDWPKGPNINTITFRDLMTHRAGFRTNCGGSRTTYAILKSQIATGVTLSDKATPSYNNCDFAIFRELLPFMEGDPIGGSESARPAKSAAFYIDYMNSHVFRRVGLGNRECKPYSAPGYPAVLSYPLPAGSAHGITWGDWTLACGGGGWVLSAQDLFWILNDLITGNRLLAPGDKSVLLASSPHCIAWDCAQGAACPNPYVCKNGALFAGTFRLHTYIGIFKCTIPVVVLVNSDMPTNIITMVKNAYNAAKVAGKPRACP
jgi:hypothetical protein